MKLYLMLLITTSTALLCCTRQHEAPSMSSSLSRDSQSAFVTPNITHEQLSRRSNDHALQLVAEVRSRYPFDIFAALGLTVVPVSSLSVNGMPCSGQVWDGSLFALFPEQYSPIDEVEFMCTLHHELAHMLLIRFKDNFSIDKWRQSLPTGFEYRLSHSQSADGGHRIQAAWLLSDILDGFLRDECRDSVDEDVAVMVEELFRNRPIFWIAVGVSPRLRTKVNVIVDFYGQIDPSFTIEGFRANHPMDDIRSVSTTTEK